MANLVDAYIEYKDRYVAFLDLLGFKEQVNIADRDLEERLKLHEILKLVQSTVVEDIPEIGMRLNYFSDCVVITVDRSSEGLTEILEAIFALTFNLLQYDVLLRGGLTAGPAYHGNEFLYGSALNRAYLLESQSAVHPMTLVAEEVVIDATVYGLDHAQWLITDKHGRHFVHFLRWFADYHPKRKIAGLRVMDFVARRLDNHTGRVREKAEWLQRYWNATVAVNGKFGPIREGTRERPVSEGPVTLQRLPYAPGQRSRLALP